MKSLPKLFAANLKKYRELRELDQSKLARAAHVGQSSISQWERGARWPRVQEIEAICSVLKIEPTQLFLEDDIGHHQTPRSTLDAVRDAMNDEVTFGLMLAAFSSYFARRSPEAKDAMIKEAEAVASFHSVKQGKRDRK